MIELHACLMLFILPDVYICVNFLHSTSEYCCSQRKRDSKPQQQERGGTGASMLEVARAINVMCIRQALRQH